MILNCKVCKHVSIYGAPKEGLKYVHACNDCDLQADLGNITFVRFGHTLASHMRQYFKVAHSHM